MTDMVERVARALCARHYAARFDKAADDEHVQMNVNAGWHIFKEDARAAIEAMRDPPNDVIEAGRWPAEDDGPLACWQAMIDAALSRQNKGD